MPFKPRTTFLVFDEGHAKFYRLSADRSALDLVAEESFAETGAHARDVVSDRQGRHGGPGGGRHAMDPPHTPHENARHAAAARVADRLDEMVRHGDLEHLVLAAPPRALGDLRAALSDAVRDRLTSEIAKDFVHLSPTETLKAVVKAMAG